MARKEKQPDKQYRFGIGEWYGKLFHRLDSYERNEFSRLQTLRKSERPSQPCPWRTGTACTKESGVCSLRLYEKSKDDGHVHVAQGDTGQLRTVCPYRFMEANTVFQWVGETILSCNEPIVVNEVPFLERVRTVDDAESPESGSVGRIDNVLVVPDFKPMTWCALEMQAVYFSGTAMKSEFREVQNTPGDSLPFPVGRRRPDYRSSGPKRLMPQLQIKVPTLRRWGKKMAVVIDDSFFQHLGPMDEVTDISNCDIAWFVVRFDERDKVAQLQRDFVRFTTLERAVEGLTGGVPVSKDKFEKRIQKKIQQN